MKRSSSRSGASVNISKQRMDLVSKLVVEDLSEILSNGVRGWLQERAQLLAELLITAEVCQIAGERNERNPEREAVRWGTQDGSILVLEQRQPIQKPRIRAKGGGSEIALETYKALNDKEFLNEKAAAKLLSGVSTRRFPETLERTLDGKGISRQTVSARAASDMSKKLQHFQTRSLEGIEILVLFMDGIHIGDDVYVAAAGVDVTGKKHILGFEPGSSESTATCQSLLKGLIQRGVLNAEKNYLFVLDGGKALRRAIKDIFGKRAYIQRCLVHKKRNVIAKLPAKLHDWFSQKFNAAYNKRSAREAESAFDRLRRELVLERRQGAADSLVEGLQELLTLHRLEIEGQLRKSLYSTNCIESMFSTARYYSRNVKRWQGEQQACAWLAAGLLEAEANLRRIPGYTQINKLKKVLGR